MKNQKIIQTWDKLNPDEACQKKILAKILYTNHNSTYTNFYLKYKRWAFACLAIVCILFTSFGTVYAANASFRNFINSLLFPLYTTDELVSIDNGHLTGSFDEHDVLLTFLDKFNQNEFGNNITALKDDGYEYSLYLTSQNEIQAFVTSSFENYQIIVYMKSKDYDNTSTIWQITGYEIVSNDDATILKKELMPYIDKPRDENLSTNTSITATKNKFLIYNINSKEKIAYLDETDSDTLMNILEKCTISSTISGDIFTYVIKKDSTSYMFDTEGNGLIDYGEEKYGFSINNDDLYTIIDIFKKYTISTEK